MEAHQVCNSGSYSGSYSNVISTYIEQYRVKVGRQKLNIFALYRTLSLSVYFPVIGGICSQNPPPLKGVRVRVSLPA
jgi:hypothetical protein